MASAFKDCALYHQTKTPINFWCKQELNPRSLIQPSETLPVALTRYTLIIYREMELQHYRQEYPLDFNKAKGIGLLCSMVGGKEICTPNVSVGNTKKCLCYGCLELVLGPRSRCVECKGCYHHKSCAELPSNCNIPSAQKHPLTLFEKLHFKRTKDIANAKYEEKTICFGCTYHCSYYDFNLQNECASLSLTMEVEVHNHPLNILWKWITFTCNLCGKEGNSV